MFGGMLPLILLLLALKRIRDVQLPISGGIVPERLLERSKSLLRLLSWNIPLGMEPVNSFCYRSTASRF